MRRDEDGNMMGTYDIEAALEAGERLGKEIGVARRDANDKTATPYAVVTDGDSLRSLEEFATTPSRIKAHVQLRDVVGFNSYVARFKNDDTTIFADRANNSLNAVIDYHSEGGVGNVKPKWCSHTAELKLEHSRAWKVWTGQHGKVMTQEVFANFLEDHYVDIVEPDSATVLESAKSLEVRKGVEAKSAMDLSTGMVQFKYIETETNAAAGSGKVPKKFTLSLPCYERGEACELTARLRYRLDDSGKLTFTYLLDRPEDVVDEAFQSVLDDVKAGTEIEPLVGAYWSV